MNPQKITQQWLAFQKQSFENIQNLLQLAQTQTSDTMDRLLDQTIGLPRENRQVIESWRTLVKKEQKRYAAFVDRGFSIYENMIEPSIKAAPTKASTSKANQTNVAS